MGVDYSVYPVAGYMVNPTMLSKFLRSRPEQSHAEDRYDSLTGKKLPEQERVVDSPQEDWWQVGPRRFHEFMDVVAYLAKRSGAKSHMWAGSTYADKEFAYILANDPGEFDHYDSRICAYAGSAFPRGLEARVRNIGRRLRKLGVPVGKPVLTVGVGIS